MMMNVFRFWINKAKVVTTAAVICLATRVTVYAGTVDYTNQKFFTGTKNLVTTGSAILTALAAVVTAFLVGKAFLAWQTAGEDEKARKWKSIWVTLGGGIGVTLSSGIVTFVLSFYN